MNADPLTGRGASRAMEARSSTHSYVNDDGSPLTSRGNSTPVRGRAKRRRTSRLTPNALSEGAAPSPNAANGAVAAGRDGEMNALAPNTATADTRTALRVFLALLPLARCVERADSNGTMENGRREGCRMQKS